MSLPVAQDPPGDCWDCPRSYVGNLYSDRPEQVNCLGDRRWLSETFPRPSACPLLAPESE